MSHRIIVRRFGIGSLARWGCISGALTALLPGLCLGWVVFAALRAARATVEGWQTARIALPLNQSLNLNFVDLLNLQSLLDALRSADAWGFAGVLLVAVGLALVLGLFVMLNVVLLGLLFNSAARLAGGISVETEPAPPPRDI